AVSRSMVIVTPRLPTSTSRIFLSRRRAARAVAAAVAVASTRPAEVTRKLRRVQSVGIGRCGWVGGRGDRGAGFVGRAGRLLEERAAEQEANTDDRRPLPAAKIDQVTDPGHGQDADADERVVGVDARLGDGLAELG